MKSDKKEIFQIGLGLSQLNNNLYDKKKFTLNSIENLISYALARGIKYFDTSHDYGDTEKILGRFNKSLKKKIHIFSKAGYISKTKKAVKKKFLL